VLSTQPLLFFKPRDQTSAERAKSFSLLCSYQCSCSFYVLLPPIAVFLGLVVDCSFACRCIEVVALRLALNDLEPDGGRTCGLKKDLGGERLQVP
jgi:hypothetical protein